MPAAHRSKAEGGWGAWHLFGKAFVDEIPVMNPSTVISKIFVPQIILTLLFLTLCLTVMVAQADTVAQGELSFHGDFRFRVEQDWDSRKSDGSFREDRSRLRYRARIGAEYRRDWYVTGVRLRTGNPIKQQDPQLTLGDGPEEFGTLAVGFEKLYFQASLPALSFGLGKVEFPFLKNNEQFWSDNVYPEGVYLQKGIATNSSSIMDSLALTMGHFLVATNNRRFADDAYFQAAQMSLLAFDGRLKLFPSLYLFRNLPDIPDGGGTFELDYTILHCGMQVLMAQNRQWKLELDYYRNLEEYAQNSDIDPSLTDQRNGYTIGLSYGELSDKGSLFLKASYNYQERFSAVDFLAQNDWARWDYSSAGSPDGRLTNYRGIEIVGSYMIEANVKLTVKYYDVNQIVAYGPRLETGQRIRFDIDVSF